MPTSRVGGLPGTRPDHVTAVAEPALGMAEAVRTADSETGTSWQIELKGKGEVTTYALLGCS
jgi:hypothetical protein